MVPRSTSASKGHSKKLPPPLVLGTKKLLAVDATLPGEHPPLADTIQLSKQTPFGALSYFWGIY